MLCTNKSMSLCNLIKIKNNTVNKPEVCLGHNNMSYALMYSSQNIPPVTSILRNANDIIANSGIESINFSRKKRFHFIIYLKAACNHQGHYTI